MTINRRIHEISGAPESDGARAEAAVPRDELPEAVDRRVHARGAEREAPAEGGGAGALLGAGQDQQRHSREQPQRRQQRRGRGISLSAPHTQPENASRRNAAVVSGGVGHRQEGHQHPQVRARHSQGQVP